MTKESCKKTAVVVASVPDNIIMRNSVGFSGSVIVAGLLMVIMVGCKATTSDFSFMAVDESEISVFSRARSRAETSIAREAGVGRMEISLKHGITATAMFELSKPTMLSPSQTLMVKVRSQLRAFVIDLYDSDSVVTLSRLVTVSGSGIIEYQVNVEKNLNLQAFQLRAHLTSTEGSLELIAVAVAPPSKELMVRNGILHVGSGFVFRTEARFDGRSLWPVDLELLPQQFVTTVSRDLEASKLSWVILMELNNTPAAEYRQLEVTLSADNVSKKFLITLRQGHQRVHLHGGEVGFRPTVLSLRQVGINSPFTSLIAVEIEHWSSAQQIGELQAVKADLDTVLRLEPKYWRQPDFELYEWNGVRTGHNKPIIVFDTIDYATQSRMFRRLAFYVEKEGYRGRMLDNTELRNLRGYNAHDYAAPDLSRFFSVAAEEAFSLTSEEIILRTVAANHGVIEPDKTGGWRSINGAILSISQESNPALRHQLLRHEMLHGLYFTHPSYQEAVTQLWRLLSSEEQLFWLLLLASVGYDTDYQPLVVNEFQAYLLQQDERYIDQFLAMWVIRLRGSHPEHEQAIKELATSVPRWIEMHRQMDAALAASTMVSSSILALLREESD